MSTTLRLLKFTAMSFESSEILLRYGIVSFPEPLTLPLTSETSASKLSVKPAILILSAKFTCTSSGSWEAMYWLSPLPVSSFTTLNENS